MIIDGHAHLGGEYKDLTTILTTLDMAGADKVVLCPADHIRRDAFQIPDLYYCFPPTMQLKLNLLW